MPKYQERKFQDKAHEYLLDVLDDRNNKINSVCMVGPPGVGKGTMSARLTKEWFMRGERSFFCVNKRNLVDGPNAYEHRLTGQMGMDSRYIGYALANMPFHPSRPMMIGTVQTAVNRRIATAHPDSWVKLVQVDECHGIPPIVPGGRKNKSQYVKVLDQHPHAQLVGWTATPERGSKREYLGLVFDMAIQICSHRWAVKWKYLVPSRVVAPITPDFSGVRTKSTGDYNERDLEDQVYTDDAIEQIADKLVYYFRGGNYRAGIVYTINSVRQCKLMRDALRRRGLRVDMITNETPNRTATKSSPYDRTGILERLGNGGLDMVVNVNVLVEGVSVDVVDFIGLAFGTKVRAKYIQAATRGSRPLWAEDGGWRTDSRGNYEKDHYLIVDCGNNVKYFNMFPEDYLVDGVNIHTPAPPPDPNATAPFKFCRPCGEMNHAAAPFCAFCGEPFPEKEASDMFAGDVEWRQLNNHVNYFLGFCAKSEFAIEMMLKSQRTPELLIPIALARNYQLGWAVDTALKLGYADRLKDKSFDSVLEWLQGKSFGVDGYQKAIQQLINESYIV